jgi:hypothetical protein
VFEDALSCILDMRIHYTPTNAAFRYKRLKALYPFELHPETEVPEDVVAALKLSYQKADAWKALRAIAQRDRWPELIGSPCPTKRWCSGSRTFPA